MLRYLYYGTKLQVHLNLDPKLKITPLNIIIVLSPEFNYN